MSAPFRLALLGALLFLTAASPQPAQEADENAKLPLDFSKDPCGNPLMESMLWHGIEGKVAGIIDGRTILLKLSDNSQLLRVRLAGIKLSGTASSDQAAREFLTKKLLNQNVEVLVNPSKWDDTPRRPRKITGVVKPRMTAAGLDDFSHALLERGLVKYVEPKPYTMPAYAACTYRRAEAEARSKKLGLWQWSGQ